MPRSHDAWARVLTPEQRQRCHEIMDRFKPVPAKHEGYRAGWSLLIEPTTGEPQYIELRYKSSISGQLLRTWVIEDQIGRYHG